MEAVSSRIKTVSNEESLLSISSPLFFGFEKGMDDDSRVSVSPAVVLEIGANGLMPEDGFIIFVFVVFLLK